MVPYVHWERDGPHPALTALGTEGVLEKGSVRIISVCQMLDTLWYYSLFKYEFCTLLWINCLQEYTYASARCLAKITVNSCFKLL